MKFQKTFICLFLTVFVCAVAVVCSEGSLKNRLCTVRNDNDVAAFFRYYGYNIILPPKDVCFITIPHSFDTVYEGYNNILRKSGFDFTPFRGKTVEKRTYRVDTSVFNISSVIEANVFIYDNRILGGDITDCTAGGFIHPLSGY